MNWFRSVEISIAKANWHIAYKYLSPTTHTDVFSIFFPENKITDFSSSSSENPPFSIACENKYRNLFFSSRISFSTSALALVLQRQKVYQNQTEFFDVSLAAAVDPTGITTTTPPKSHIFHASDSEISIEICRSKLARSCSTSTQS